MYFKKQNNLLAIALLFWVVVLAGCAPQTPQFVVLRDVPESPSFVVIPANNYLHEVEFANKVENAIISAGIKVVLRPATKDVTTEKIIQGAEGQQAADVKLIQSAEAKLIERYSAFEDIDTDYIVLTYVTSRQVKIAKRETREILVVLLASQPEHYSYTWPKKIYETLAKMGLPVVKK
jgi:hypothetical protein